MIVESLKAGTLEGRERLAREPWVPGASTLTTPKTNALRQSPLQILAIRATVTMLKNRSKSFAPKFKPGARRPTANPPSAQSSARPSVEPQSQTPAPETAAKETTPFVPENSAAPQQSEERTTTVEPIVQPTSSHEEAGTEQTTATHEPDANLSTSSLKRKSRDDDTSEPPAKRVPVAASEDESHTVAPGPLPSPDITAQKRKSPDDDASQPPAKRRATPPPAENVDSNTSSEGAPRATSDSTNDENALPSYISELVSSEPHTHTHEVAGETALEPEKPPSVEDSTTESLIPTTEASEAQHSRPGTPESNHEASRFRYPTPDNTQPMSGVVLPGFGPAGAVGGDLPGLGPAGNTNSLLQAGQAVQNSQAVPMAGLNPDGTAAPIEEPASGCTRRR
ncbi:hypothetical protein G7Y89_g14536 [Cudoniella acicularis]|uniref:Uncharacterized protein n=1 Tax=Cudoniella acicularis TaxID=354080 RepID=A0A8H4R3A2_9HELO|nr:hypothetical protein G7Y89_g14536 [Cudoniella acicularis]